MTTKVEYDVTITDDAAERFGIRRSTVERTRNGRTAALATEIVMELSKLEVLGLVSAIGVLLLASTGDAELTENVVITVPGLGEMTRYDAAQIASALIRYLV